MSRDTSLVKDVKDAGLQALLTEQLKAAHDLLVLNQAITRHLEVSGQLKPSPSPAPSSSARDLLISPLIGDRGTRLKSHYGRLLFKEALGLSSDDADEQVQYSTTKPVESPVPKTQSPSAERYETPTDLQTADEAREPLDETILETLHNRVRIESAYGVSVTVQQPPSPEVDEPFDEPLDDGVRAEETTYGTPTQRILNVESPQLPTPGMYGASAELPSEVEATKLIHAGGDPLNDAMIASQVPPATVITTLSDSVRVPQLPQSDMEVSFIDSARSEEPKYLNTSHVSMESEKTLPPRVPADAQAYPDALDLRTERALAYQMPQSALTEPLLSADRDAGESPEISPRKEPAKGVPELPRRRNKNVFCTKAPTKKRIQANTQTSPTHTKRHEYNVEDLYKETGLFPDIARNQMFQNTTLIIIVMNTFWMAIDTDYNDADILSQAAPLFVIVDNFFCTYFTFEITVRFMAFAKKVDICGDFWFLFDSALVTLMIWETWIQVVLYEFSNGDDADTGGGMRSASVIRIFRAFRLLRISRMTRLLRSMPELFILVKSIGAAMRCMMVTLVMLMLVIYIFAIMFTQLLRGTPLGAKFFPTVPHSINFMLTQVLCGFDVDVITDILTEGWIYYALWLLYVLIGSLSIMNVLIGILCEVVSGTADTERERAVRKDIENSLDTIGIVEDENISKREMMMALESTPVAVRLEELGVDVEALLDFVHVFEESTEMTVEDFVEMVVQFRGGKSATVRDIVDFRKFVSMEVSFLEAHICQLTHGSPHQHYGPGPMGMQLTNTCG